MPGRAIPLITDYVYHVFNRGSEKKDIFLQLRDYKRFLQTVYYYQFPGPKQKFSQFAKSKLSPFKSLAESRLVDIICYCLMPNHFHFVLRQLQENGISIFISQLANSYTKYFNTKYDRVGALLQGVFKSVFVETDEQFIHLSRYIHLNPVISGLVKDLERYPWSSYNEYIHERNGLCSTGNILSLFPSRKHYRQFVEEQIEYATSLELIKHQLIDEH